jgi:glycosyltransferase involved in cell wall biosynthesis
MLVSCICVTANRRHLIPVALACFVAQDYRDRELIVVDDGEDAIGDLLWSLPGRVTYRHIGRGKTVSEKVNLACELAKGDIIATWDDDDWSAPGRLTDQVTRLLESGRVLTGYYTMLYWDGQKAWRYLGNSDYATGLSQVYHKDFWAAHRLQAKNVAYDNDLWRDARQSGQCIAVEGNPPLMVGRIHPLNVSPKNPVNGNQWREEPLSAIPAAFFEAIR